MIIKPEWEQHIKNEVYLWKLGNQTRTSKMKNQSVLITKHIARDCKKPKKEKNTRNCYKCGQTGHIAKD